MIPVCAIFHSAAGIGGGGGDVVFHLILSGMGGEPPQYAPFGPGVRGRGGGDRLGGTNSGGWAGFEKGVELRT